MNNVKLIGTNHIMTSEEIIKIIEENKPEVIGIELCKIREYIYINKIETKEEEDKSLLGKISNAIKKKAKEENVEYGSDMYTALQYSIDNKVPYVLVDKSIEEIQTLFQKIPQKEQEGFIKEITKFEKETIAENTVDEQEFLKNLKEEYPMSFEILINSREQHIVIQILKLKMKYPDKKILIFLGKGHINSITKLLEEEE